MKLLMRMGTRPNHAWAPDKDVPYCVQCPVSSPFRLESGAHRYVIEEAL